MSLGGRDPRRSHREPEEYEFPLVRGPDGKVRLVIAANSAIAVDPQRGAYVRVDGTTTEVSSASPYAIRARIAEGIEVTKQGMRPLTSESVVAGRRGRLEARVKAEDVATDEDGLDVQAALERLDDAKQNLNAKGVANGYASLDGDGLVPTAQLPATAETMLVPFYIGTSAALAWSAMPGAGLLLGSPRHVQNVDLSQFTQARLSVFVEVVGNGGSFLAARYGLGHSSNWEDYGPIGESSSEVSCAIDATGHYSSGWVTLDAAAKADVFLAIIGLDGDEVESPEFGSITLEVR